MTHRRILWSGGFDSTYLVVDALVAGHHVEAIRSDGWQDVHKAVKENIARLRIVAALPAELRAHLDEREENHTAFIFPNIWQAHDELTAAVGGDWTSAQNGVLFLMPEIVGPRCEVGIVKDDNTAGQPAVLSVLNLRGLDFPLVERTKADLWEDARRRGFDDLLAMTWSCEGPGDRGVLGLMAEPCGECTPCRLRIIATETYVGA